MLELVDVRKSFGGLRALDGLSFEVREGEILGLIGPNGSGKSTAFNVVSGALKSDHGSVFFSGRDITGLPPHRISRLGVARTFQVVRPFRNLTALQNVLAGTLFGRQNGDSGEDPREALAALERWGYGESGPPCLLVHHRERNGWRPEPRCRPKQMLLTSSWRGHTHEIPSAVELIKSIRESGVTVVVVEHVVKAITGRATE